MSVDKIKRIETFHKSFPEYAVTPLVSLRNLSRDSGTGGIYVKDESGRFGLESFKALGCTYAIASYIAQRSGIPVCELDFETMVKASRSLGELTFYAATDGNHGRAVAWMAKMAGQKAVIYMNKGCPDIRRRHISEQGAVVTISDLNYDDTIRYVIELAEETPGSVIIQDTAWEGYEDIPARIMQGYAVMALEACRQLEEAGVIPTHVILQAGVGAFAGAMQAFISNYYGGNAPVTFIVEPETAACYYKSVQRGDGERVYAGGEMNTIMAGLACGEPSPVAWDIIKNKSRYFATITDEHTKQAMRLLGKAPYGDKKIISGESGAAGMGFLLQLLNNDELTGLRELSGIGRNSNILVFSTEGATDPLSYKQIME